ncbi:MAG: endonuclease III [Ignavibacteria bacterium]|nr:endonuclease III [Ignavibacteria bacterium]
MKNSRLRKVIELLSEYFGKPFDNNIRQPSVLDVLIATKLSQNTTDKSSYAAFTNLKKTFTNWEKAAEAGLDELKDCIKVCGLSNTKSKNIKVMLNDMIRNYGTLDLSFMKKYRTEKVYEELLQYDGIGIKTISCVLIFAMGKDAFPVDTHVHRVLNRLGLVRTNSPVKTFEQMSGKIPEGKKYELHSNLIKFGRNICRAKNPLCSICFLYSLCRFKEKSFYRKQKAPLNKGDNNFIILENI